MPNPSCLNVLRKLLILFLFLLVLHRFSLAQFDQETADSLELVISRTEDHESKADLLDKLALMYHYENPKKAARLTHKAIKIAEEHLKLSNVAILKTHLGAYYYVQNQTDSFLLVTQEILTSIQGKGLHRIEASNTTNLAMIAEENGEYEKAITYYKQAMAIPFEDTMIRLVIDNNLGNLYNDLYDFEKALAHLLEARTFAKALGIEEGPSAVLTNIGISYRSLKEFEKAVMYFQQTIDLTEKNGDASGQVDALVGMGTVYREMDSVAKAIHFFEEAVEVGQQTQNPDKQLSPLIELGDIYVRQSRPEKAYETFQQCLQLLSSDNLESRSDEALIHLGLSQVYNLQEAYPQADEAARKAIEQEKGTEKGVSATLIQAYQELARAQFGRGLYRQAYHNQQEVIFLSDSLGVIENIQATKSLELKYNVAEKEKEMAILEAEKNAEIKTQKAFNRFFVALALLALFIAVMLFVFLRQRTHQKQQISLKNQTISQQAEKLQELDQLKSRLFANVSHELRTPLTLILGPLSSALKSDNLDNKTSTFLRLAQQNGQKLLQLVNEILDLSKMDAGKLKLVEKPVLLLPFIRRLLSQFESHAQDKQVELSLDFEPDQYIKIRLDVQKFEIIFNNLLANALKFSPKKGQLSIQIKHQGNTLSLNVSDMGPGIHPDDQLHIFDRFYQATHSESESEGGTGIGLAICKEYAKLFGGDIQVHSQLGQGAQFIFHFPLKEVFGAFEEEIPETAIPDEKLLYTSSPLSGEQHILLVEDNYSLRSYIKAVLGNQFQITTAENGQAALDILDSLETDLKIDLIISDVMMPVMDGFQLLDVLKGRQKFRSIPVIMLTAKASLRDKLHALRIGVDDYMTKPFEEEELLARVSNLLRNAENRHLPEQKEEIELVQEDTETSETNISEEDQEWLTILETSTKALMGDLNFTIDDLAHEVGASRRQVHRRVKRLTGLTPNQYLQEVRMQQARFFLETRQLSSVKATSLEVGMKDVKYFSQQFRIRFGKLPSEYLKLEN
ncbi:MAG: tetratricopeptide repeat protein [Bacteroidota bacterium]